MKVHKIVLSWGRGARVEFRTKLNRGRPRRDVWAPHPPTGGKAGKKHHLTSNPRTQHLRRPRVRVLGKRTEALGRPEQGQARGLPSVCFHTRVSEPITSHHNLGGQAVRDYGSDPPGQTGVSSDKLRYNFKGCTKWKYKCILS